MRAGPVGGGNGNEDDRTDAVSKRHDKIEVLAVWPSKTAKQPAMLLGGALT